MNQRRIPDREQYMTAWELFHEGRLQDALGVQHQLVQAKPRDSAARLLLAEMLLIAGDFDTVRRQLEEVPRDRPGMDDYLRAWQLLIDAETKRQRLMTGGEPSFLLEPPEHVHFRLQAIESLRNHQIEAAVDCLDEAEGCSPWVTGHIDGREFDGARDTDELLGTTLELLIEDQYAWFPFEEMQRLRIGKIESLRDCHFIPALLTARSGEEWHVHLPGLYLGSSRCSDELLRTGQTTDWEAADLGPTRGVGRRLLTFGEEELSLLDFTQWEG